MLKGFAFGFAVGLLLLSLIVQPLQNPSCFAGWEITEVIIMRSYVDEPARQTYITISNCMRMYQ